MSTIQNPILVASTSSTTRTPKSVMGKDDFLSLLVTQMRNQDPMDPMKGADFAAQLAQFSSLEQLTNINVALEQSLSASAMMTNSINNALAATFIGKEVRATASSFQYQGAGSINLGYSLAAAGDSATVKICDDAGNVVRTLSGSTFSGVNSITWDGKNDSGEAVGSGTYTFKVEATDKTGGALDASTYLYGKISGVRFKAEGAFFVIDGMEIPLSSIVEIKEG
jgi:flagellar basal-body rod modification protein FlgD